MSATAEVIEGVFQRYKYRSEPDDNGRVRIIAYLENGTAVLGVASEDDMPEPGMRYSWYGTKKVHPEWGDQFHFQSYGVLEPLNREGVVTYLSRYATGVGVIVAGRLWDAYGADAIKMVRTQPELCSQQIKGFRLDQAKQAAEELQKIAATEEIRSRLLGMFHGRGFPGTMTDQCIEKWGVNAPMFIQRDPFILMVNDMPGAGFARCDRFYCDLGKPLNALKRQMLLLWNYIHDDSSGDTWLPADRLSELLNMMLSNCIINFKRAVKLGVRARWLRTKKDAATGQWYIGEWEKTGNERELAKRVRVLMGWREEDLKIPKTETEESKEFVA